MECGDLPWRTYFRRRPYTGTGKWRPPESESARCQRCLFEESLCGGDVNKKEKYEHVYEFNNLFIASVCVFLCMVLSNALYTAFSTLGGVVCYMCGLDVYSVGAWFGSSANTKG